VTSRNSSKARSRHPPTAAARARTAAAAARKDEAIAESRRERRERGLRFAVLAGIVLVGGGLIFSSWHGNTPAPAAPADLATVSGVGAQLPPPWPAPADVPGRVKAASLPLGGMGTAEHYHVHLDVLVNGKAITVPANVGVDQSSGQMSYLHTHTPDGIVHIEAGRAGEPFTLGQLFTEWNVRLTATQLGALKTGADSTLALYVNGKKVPGDPARLRLRPHQQIALLYGPSSQKVTVPSSYNFAPGE
jgi:hypothetical protein